MFWEFLSAANYKKVETPAASEPLQKTLQYIHHFHAEPCDLRLLSKVSGVCEAHLIRLFKNHLNCTPIEFLWKMRVDSGAKLLRETGLSVSEIAYRVGFQNPYHFSRLFKKFIQSTPLRYRKKSWL